ncbi:UBX domain-containing protein 11-like isoform X2 [Ostrea edulis]|uniref:UBX domain-containing protein 11-like isoform X2 n=1 Tax=Ostrea edulis TaxID=37623 RepID=UPI002095E51A|nr:UBX domain-containing protein 11-like isoform X2 [Ostrea edulis]
MSSPLSSLKKSQKNPLLLGRHDELTRPAPTESSRSMPFRSPAYSEDESRLLEEITHNMATSRLKAAHARTDPFQGGLPKLDTTRSHVTHSTPVPRVNNAPLERMKSSSSFVDDPLPDNATFLTAPPSDQELMTSMMTRITILEQKVQSQTKELTEKDKKIKILEDKVKIMKKAQGDLSPRESRELEKKCLLLQQQVHEMEAFLADYGMVWVGEKSDTNSTYYNDKSSSDSESDEEMWRPNTSLNHNFTPATITSTAVKPETVQSKFTVDYDRVIENIKDLNVLAGEGVSKIQHTTDGARLRLPDPVPLVLYANGIMLFGGPFRPFTDPLTQQCAQDIQDGYFPSELQTKFPDGVPFVVTDYRDTYFKDTRQEVFRGTGQVLGGETRPSRLVPESKTAEKNHDAVPMNTPEHTQFKVATERPGPKMSVGQFLQKLPKSVIKDGKVIDIRDAVGENFRDAKTSQSVMVVETDTVKDMKKRLDGSESSRPITPRNITTLRVKSDTGSQTYILKMKFQETIRDLRKYIDLHRPSNSQAYNIVSAYPSKTFDNEEITLLDAGLTPNAVLHLRVRK